MKGITISFWWDSDGSFLQIIKNEHGLNLIQLNPWLGVQMEADMEKPKDWTRKNISKYEPNDLNEYLRRIGESESMKPKSVG